MATVSTNEYDIVEAYNQAIVVRVEMGADTTSGGIYIPQASQKCEWFRVVSASPEIRPALKHGDRVIFGGKGLWVDSRKGLVAVQAFQVLAVWRGDTAQPAGYAVSVIAKREALIEKSEGGIIIPDNRQRNDWYRVVSVGEDVDPRLSVGDLILPGGKGFEVDQKEGLAAFGSFQILATRKPLPAQVTQ